MKGLTKTQKAYLDYMKGCQRELGRLPTIREAALEFGVCLHAAQNHIEALKAKGCFAQVEFGKARCGKITGGWLSDADAKILDKYDKSDPIVKMVLKYAGVS